MPERTAPAPFFTAPGAGPESTRVLLLSYLFPPSQAVGALRWQKFAGHFAEAGIGLDAITLDPTQLGSRDASRLAELPASTRVFGVKQPSLASERVEQALLGLRRWLRSERPAAAGAARTGGSAGTLTRTDSFSRMEILNGVVPSPQLLHAHHARQDLARIEAWAALAAQFGERIVDPQCHRAVISCGPPHPVHEGARRIARRFGLPLVIDLRDPWALVERIPAHIASATWYRRSAKLEQRVVRAASLIVLNTEPALRAMQAAHPEAAERMLCVMNGCDNEFVPAPSREERFLVAYAGTVYLDRDPRPLFLATRHIIEELSLTPGRFALEFMGHAASYGGRSLESIASEEGVADFFRVHPPRPRAEALEFLASASLLVTLPQDSNMAIPSKLFEYFQFEAWILALAEQESATAALLLGTSADIISARDPAGIAGVLRKRYLEWQRGERPQPLSREQRFTRRHQAAKLLSTIGPLVGRPDLAGLT